MNPNMPSLKSAVPEKKIVQVNSFPRRDFCRCAEGSCQRECHDFLLCIFCHKNEAKTGTYATVQLNTSAASKRTQIDCAHILFIIFKRTEFNSLSRKKCSVVCLIKSFVAGLPMFLAPIQV